MGILPYVCLQCRASSRLCWIKTLNIVPATISGGGGGGDGGERGAMVTND